MHVSPNSAKILVPGSYRISVLDKSRIKRHCVDNESYRGGHGWAKIICTDPFNNTCRLYDNYLVVVSDGDRMVSVVISLGNQWCTWSKNRI